MQRKETMMCEQEKFYKTETQKNLLKLLFASFKNHQSTFSNLNLDKLHIQVHYDCKSLDFSYQWVLEISNYMINSITIQFVNFASFLRIWQQFQVSTKKNWKGMKLIFQSFISLHKNLNERRQVAVRYDEKCIVCHKLKYSDMN